MPSFDIVSEVEHQEVKNALNQAQKEVSTRYDFRDTNTTLELSDKCIVIVSNGEARLRAAFDVLREKMVKRGVAIESLHTGSAEQAGGGKWKQQVELKEGIEQVLSKKIIKFLKDSKIKVQAAIQGDTVRVTGKKRDDLQAAIALLKEKKGDFDQPLQFTNFRD